MAQKRIKIYPFVLVIVIFAFAVVLQAFIKTAQKKYSADRELLEASRRVAKLAEENERIRNEIHQYQYDSFVEKEMRTSLNLKQQGEEVIFIAGRSAHDESVPQENTNTAYQKKEKSAMLTAKENARAWFDYIFVSQ